jgi:hypothetical protein
MTRFSGAYVTGQGAALGSFKVERPHAEMASERPVSAGAVVGPAPTIDCTQFCC